MHFLHKAKNWVLVVAVAVAAVEEEDDFGETWEYFAATSMYFAGSLGSVALTMKNFVGIHVDFAEMSADSVRTAGSHSHQAEGKKTSIKLPSPRLRIGCTILPWLEIIDGRIKAILYHIIQEWP